MKTTEKSRYSAPALEKGLDILEYLAGQPVARSQTEIGLSLKRSQGEIYRMLSCLEMRGYVQKEEHSGNYRLTLRLYEVAHRQSATVSLRHAALLPMDALAEETGQSCHLSVQYGSLILVLMERMPARRVCLAVGDGTTLPLSQSTSGKVLLSRMTEEDVRLVLEKDTNYQAASTAARKKLSTDIKNCRSDGHVVEHSMLTDGTSNVAVPIGVDHTDTAGVIAIPFIGATNNGGKKSQSYLKAALACAKEINRNLGINQ